MGIHKIRSLTPPGRFLIQDIGTKLWYDVGDDKARRKVSQALRESREKVSNFKKNKSVVKNDTQIEIHYSDLKQALEKEMINEFSPVRKKMCRTLQEMEPIKEVRNSIHLESFKRIKSNNIVQVELSLPEVETMINGYKSNKIKFQNADSGSLIDIKSVGTFSIQDMSLSFDSNISSDELESLFICFNLDRLSYEFPNVGFSE